MKNRSRGFTLMELMLVVALAAVILGIGVPSFKEFSRNNRMVTIANDFLGGVQSARTEAIKRQLAVGGVAVCSSTNPEEAMPTCLGAADKKFDGWIAFVDANNNCDRDAGETVLRSGKRIDMDNTTASYRRSVSNGSCISFAATGFVVTNNGKTPVIPVRTLYCDERGNVNQGGTALSVARGVEVTATGRARITRDIDELTAWGIPCP
jgi:prepilin-type N-terminal cleavage/methylation domain-containing protein